ncbi:MAG: hypothetical protein ACC630_06400 [Nitrospinota bacterium]
MNMNERQFEKLTATQLYCNKCCQSMPVRERLLLVLQDGNLYDYNCVQCGESLGKKKETKQVSLVGKI